jgi:hypothetical protein
LPARLRLSPASCATRTGRCAPLLPADAPRLASHPPRTHAPPRTTDGRARRCEKPASRRRLFAHALPSPMPPPAPLPVDACLLSMQSRTPTYHPPVHARAQEIKELRGGEQAWDHSGINHAFKTVDAVPRKKAPALERAKRFGAQQPTHTRTRPAAPAPAPAPSSPPLDSARNTKVYPGHIHPLSSESAHPAPLPALALSPSRLVTRPHQWPQTSPLLAAGLKTWTALSPEEQGKHGWNCTVCSSCPSARQFFGKAVAGAAGALWLCTPSPKLRWIFFAHTPNPHKTPRKNLLCCHSTSPQSEGKTAPRTSARRRCPLANTPQTTAIVHIDIHNYFLVHIK